MNLTFSRIFGKPIPWIKPNVSKENEAVDLLNIIQDGYDTSINVSDKVGIAFSCISILGLPYYDNDTNLPPIYAILWLIKYNNYMITKSCKSIEFILK